MIHLDQATKPAQLDQDTVDALTQEFKLTEKPVWNKAFIRQALLNSSHQKCAYCEVNIVEESKYMEVDHFRCKSHFPDLVVEWSNLIPSCKRCNIQKSSHNVDLDGMLINPYTDDPNDHLYLMNYRYKWRDNRGRVTVETLYLNDTDRLVGARFKIGEAVAKALEILRNSAEDFTLDKSNARKRNGILRGISGLLSLCAPSQEYSATTATVLLSDPDYIWIKRELEIQGLWGNLDSLEQSARAAALLL